MMIRYGFSLAAIAVALPISAGCSNSGATESPISPSPLAAPSVSSGATVSGVVTIENATLSSGMTVSVAGTEIAAPVDSSGQFTLAGVPPGDIQLRFANTGVDAAVPIQGVAEQEQIQINVTVSGGNAMVTAQHRTDSEHRVESRGLVSALSGSCPDLTFTVNGTTVLTNSSTIFEDGPCGVVQNGTRVEVKGTRQSNGSVLATKVDIDGNNPTAEIRAEGSVSALTGTCPVISFTVNGTSVVTNSSTRFEDGPCSALQNGTRVEVKGTSQSDGSILATKVDIDQPDPEIELKGTISGLGGACPDLTLTVAGTSVATNNLTRFDDGPCTAVANGNRVEVKGTRQPNGSVVANKVDIDESDPEVEVKGTTTGLAGTCPNVTFTVNGSSVATNSSTRFDDGTCSLLQNGAKIEVKGIRQANGTLLAIKVDIDHPDPEVELRGSVVGLAGACPSLTFTLGGTPVVTDRLTRFDDRRCSAIGNGSRVEVDGIRQSNGSVVAHKVEVDR